MKRCTGAITHGTKVKCDEPIPANRELCEACQDLEDRYEEKCDIERINYKINEKLK